MDGFNRPSVHCSDELRQLEGAGSHDASAWSRGVTNSLNPPSVASVASIVSVVSVAEIALWSLRHNEDRERIITCPSDADFLPDSNALSGCTQSGHSYLHHALTVHCAWCSDEIKALLNFNSCPLVLTFSLILTLANVG